jgi:uncharacterized protein YgiM (DUF1202 family)
MIEHHGGRTMSKIAKTTLIAAALATALPFAAFTGPASAQVTSCDAPGGRQEAGALIGALAGGVLGSNLAKNDRGTGTAIGAVAGAAAGSYVGCKQQQARARTQAAARPAGPYGQGSYYSTSSMNIRSGPSTSNRVVDHLGAYERFDIVSRSGNWVRIAKNGYTVGFISNAYVRPV